MDSGPMFIHLYTQNGLDQFCMVKKRKSSNQLEKDRQDNRERMSTFAQKNPKDYPRLPLFALHKEQTCYLNQVFWLVYNDATTSWRSLSSLHRSRVEDIEALAEAGREDIAQ